ncbi:MAG: hypothetical protein JXQ30_05580 [Spirochaetes bacterium]|nr:hypothetical protein [Spirochaetota bacterium]
MAEGKNHRVAGILNIVSGCLSLLGFLVLLAGIVITSNALGIPGVDAVPDFVSLILTIIAIPTLGIGVVSLVGGIFALQKKSWGLLLAGSIASVISFFVLGVLAIVFTVIAKDEFDGE